MQQELRDRSDHIQREEVWVLPRDAQPPVDGRSCSGWWRRQESQSQSWGTPLASSASSLQMVSDVLSIKITTGQTQINLTDLTDRVKQAEDRISLNENKLLTYEKDLKLRIQ